MNANWQRWIFSSIAKHFQDGLDNVSIKLFVEGAPRDTEKVEDWVELRQNGPKWSGGTKDEWTAEIEINAFIISKMNQSDNYRIHRNIGLVTTLFLSGIPVFKLGDGIDDDQSFITCLQLITKGKEQLRVVQLGQVSNDTQLMRGMVDGIYTGHFFG